MPKSGEGQTETAQLQVKVGRFHGQQFARLLRYSLFGILDVIQILELF